MNKTQLESNQAYPVRYSRVWRECWNCGGTGLVECDEGPYFDVKCPECKGEKGKWVEEKR